MDRRAHSLPVAILIIGARLASAGDQIQVISGGNSIAPGPDGTLYMLGMGSIDTTPSAYLSSPPNGSNFLRHLDPATGRVLYATYLNFFPSGIFIDAKGAAYLTGKPSDLNFSISPGAYNGNITGAEQLVVSKLNPSGTAMEAATLLGGSGYGYGSAGIPGIALGPDGSVYVTGTTCSKDFPTTPDALFVHPPSADGGCDAFFSKLSADFSQLVYSTYLGGSENSAGLSISLGDDGQIHVAGRTDASNFPTTPGTFTLPVSDAYRTAVFLASWDPGSRRFTTLAAFGNYLNPLAVAWTGKSVAVECFNGGDPMAVSADAIWPVTPGSMVVLVLDETNWQLVHAMGLPYFFVTGMALDADGSLTIAGDGEDEPNAIPASPGAYGLSASNGEFVAKFDPSGSHITEATYLEVSGEFFRATITPGLIYVSTGDPQVQVNPPFPVIASRPAGECATIRAWPNVVQQCGVTVPRQSLYWDACYPQVAGAEIHAGSPNGPLLASSTSGVLDVSPSNTTYYLLDNAGHTLGAEQVTYQPAPRCSAVADPAGQLTASPNPVLSCAANPTTGTQTLLQGYGPGPLDIHVNAANGPLLTHSPGGGAESETGDWVQDGTAFFLTNSNTGQVLATERVFLLPIRSCVASAPVPPAALQTTPSTISACGTARTATLAWNSAGIHPVEIRESAQSGRTVARFDQTSGLLDVSPTGTLTYRLVGYTSGVWHNLASATLTVSTAGCK